MVVLVVVAVLSLVGVFSARHSQVRIENAVTSTRSSKPLNDCDQILQKQLAATPAATSVIELLKAVPSARLADIVSVSKDGATIEKFGLKAQAVEGQLSDLARLVKRSHKFAIVDKSYLFLYPDNTVITADRDSCALQTIFLPTSDGKFHPQIELTATKHLHVTQDKDPTKSPTRSPTTTRQPTGSPSTSRPTPVNQVAKECGIPLAADSTPRHAQSTDAHFDDGDAHTTETFHFPDMVHLSEYHDEIFQKYKDLIPDKDGFFSRNVRVTGAHGRYLNVNFRGRYKDRTHFYNLETEEDLVRFGCTSSTLALEFENESAVDRVKANLDRIMKSTSIDHVMVTGKQLLRCPKSKEPDFILKHHEFGDRVRPSETRMTQSVRRVVGMHKKIKSRRVWLHVDTTYANLMDVFSDLEFSGGTDMVERDSELRRKKFRHDEANENGILDVHRDAYESLKKDMVYPRVRLSFPLVADEKRLGGVKGGRRMIVWLKTTLQWVADKVVKPVVNLVVDATTAVTEFVRSVAGTIMQPMLKFLGRRLPQLLNKKGTHPIGRPGSVLASVNYDASTGHAKNRWEIDTNGIQTGGIFELGAKTSAILLASGKVACKDCFVRFYNGTFSWHVIIGGEKLGLLELKSRIGVELSVELDATVSIITQVTQAFEGIPIPFLSIELGAVTLGFSLDPEISIGIQWDANGFYYKYHAQGWQEFGIRASIVGEVETIRDGYIEETTVGPLIKDSVKASLYIIPLVALVFSDVMAVEGAIQPTISFLLKPNEPSPTCVLDYAVEFDSPIVVGAWIGLKTSFGMWRIAGFSQAFSVLPTVTIASGCLVEAKKKEIERVSGWSLSTTDAQNTKKKAASAQSAFTTETSKFHDARCKVMKDHMVQKAFPSDQEKWVVSRDRPCARACREDAGNEYSEFRMSSDDYSVCAGNYANEGWRTGFVQGNECFAADTTTRQYKCFCVKDHSKYSLEQVQSGGSCANVCELSRKFPVVSGAWGANKIYYVCGKRVPDVHKWRAGFNPGGSSSATFKGKCAIGSTAHETAFSCLCRAPTIPIPPPLRWVQQSQGADCPATCDRLAQYPVATPNYVDEVFYVCRVEIAPSTNAVNGKYLGGYETVLKTVKYLNCAPHTSQPHNVSCLCTQSIERLIRWYDGVGMANCKRTCEYNWGVPISVDPESQKFVCRAKVGHDWLVGENPLTTRSTCYYAQKSGSVVGSVVGSSQYMCACSHAPWQKFVEWE